MSKLFPVGQGRARSKSVSLARVALGALGLGAISLGALSLGACAPRLSDLPMPATPQSLKSNVALAAPSADWPGDGWWTVDMAKDLRSFVGTYTDPHTPAQTALYAIDGRRLAWIEECGHCSHLEQPAALLAAISDFCGLAAQEPEAAAAAAAL